jgi:hypothetical protein
MHCILVPFPVPLANNLNRRHCHLAGPLCFGTSVPEQEGGS